MKKKKKKTGKVTKSLKPKPDVKKDESSDFGSVTVLKAGTSLAALLLSESSNGMTGPIY